MMAARAWPLGSDLAGVRTAKITPRAVPALFPAHHRRVASYPGHHQTTLPTPCGSPPLLSSQNRSAEAPGRCYQRCPQTALTWLTQKVSFWSWVGRPEGLLTLGECVKPRLVVVGVEVLNEDEISRHV